MLIKAQKEITRISDDEELNMRNYLDSLNFVSGLYIFINKLKTVVSTDDVSFLPTFYGQHACMTLKRGITGKENEMKILKLSSTLFLVDKTATRVKNKLEDLCEEISQDGEIITFVLK